MRFDVLIIDSDARTSATLSELLRDEGYDVLALPDASEFLEALVRVRPRVVLLTPSVSGRALTAALKEAHRRLLLMDTVLVPLTNMEAPMQIRSQASPHGNVREPFNQLPLMKQVARACGRYGVPAARTTVPR